MDPVLIEQIGVAAAMGLIGAVVFAAIGLVSGTDETTTLAPLTLLVVLLGVPPAGVFTFFLAGAVAKHMTHAVPTALLGIPGDTLATPLLQDADLLRKLGVPHIALRKMISGAIIAAFVAVPLAVLFAVMLAPFGQAITKTAPWIFLCAALLQEDIDAWGDCPNNAALEAAQAGTSGAAARALADLMALNLRLAPLNGDGSGDAL